MFKKKECKMCDRYLIGQKTITDNSNFVYLKPENKMFKFVYENNLQDNSNSGDSIKIMFCPWCGRRLKEEQNEYVI